jgi:hypothetical protein
MHLSPATTEDAIRLLDGRQAGVELAEDFADIILDTQRGRRRVVEIRLPPSRLRRYGGQVALRGHSGVLAAAAFAQNIRKTANERSE